jgi:hypothetical protein
MSVEGVRTTPRRAAAREPRKTARGRAVPLSPPDEPTYRLAFSGISPRCPNEQELRTR